MSGGRNKGFTLIELVVVLAIIGVLAAIAIPSYQRYVRKANRSEAIAALLNMQLQQEKWRANNSSYSSVASSVGAPTSAEALRYYAYTVSNASISTFTLTATAQSASGQNADNQSGTSCSVLSLDQGNTKTPAACWR